MADEHPAFQYLSARLDRVDSKLDELSSAITSLVRIEERMSTYMDGMKRLGDRQDRMDNRIASLEQDRTRLTVVVGLLAGAAGLVAPYVARAVLGG